MLAQQQLIERVRQLCVQDERLAAAMMYGSFAKGSGDAFSDIEFVLFFHDEVLVTLNQSEWLAQIAPLDLCFVNEFGVTDVIFANLIRGEFHFDKISEVAVVSTWRDDVKFPALEATLVVDKTGALTPHLTQLIGSPHKPATAEQAQFVVNAFINWFVFGFNVLRRGETAHALGLLWWVQQRLSQMARLLAGETNHWHSPLKALEQDLPAEAYSRFQDCTSHLKPAELWSAYVNCWQWGMVMISALKQQYRLTLSDSLLQRVGELVSETSSRNR
jgi:lincosamide nucleotidyltransferase B/F